MNDRELHQPSMAFPIGQPNDGFAQYFSADPDPRRLLRGLAQGVGRLPYGERGLRRGVKTTRRRGLLGAGRCGNTHMEPLEKQRPVCYTCLT